MNTKVKTLAASKYFRLKEVTDGVYAAICINGSGSLGNAAIVDLGDATIVVDTTMSLRAAQDLWDAAEQLTGRPVTYVFNTHWHGDHTAGNQIFAPEARFISTNKTREIMATICKDRLDRHKAQREELNAQIDQYEKDIDLEKDEKIRKEMKWEVAGDREYLKMLPELKMVLPALTFDDEMMLHGSRRSVKLMSYGGGHTQSDGFLYMPVQKLVVTGDLVLSGFHPTMSHGNPWEWVKILDRIAGLDIERIIPGHGEVCTKDTLYEVREYLDYMIGLAETLGPDDDVLDNVAVPEKYDSWLFRPDFKMNLKRIRELSRGEQPS